MNNKIGRPPLSETEKSVTVTITMKPSQKAFLKEYGFGYVALGVRRLVDEKMKKGDENAWAERPG